MRRRRSIATYLQYSEPDEATDKLLWDLRDSRTDLGKLAERPHEPTADRIRNRQHDDGERRKLGSERR